MRRVLTALGRVAMSEVDLSDLSSLTPGERLELEGRPARTVAARVALKRAASGLFEELTGVPRAPTDFEFLREEDGGTVPLRFPDPGPGIRVAGPLRCSLSHTARIAYAIAALEVDDDR